MLLRSLLRLILAAPIMAAHAADPATDARAARERAAIAECHGQSLITEHVNLNAGVYNERIQVSSPLHIDIPVGVNPGQLQDCLTVRGVAPESANLAYREHADTCRERYLGAGTVRLVSEENLKLSGADTRAYHECLRNGPTLDVEVTFPDDE